MQDPSGGVPAAVLQHVHLISSFKYPYHPSQLGLEEALNHLRRATQIVRELAPVYWSYLNHPTNGTVLLTWQPIAQLGAHFASDGYVWAAPESVYTQEVHGFTVEILVHESGFIPNVEQVAAHRRTRYRLVSGPNNTPVDQSLEIVHYTAAFPEHHVSVRAIQPQQATQKQMSERRYLEHQGVLDKKEFMLHDRHKWPAISIPGNPVQAGHNQPVISFGRPGMPQYQDARGPAGPSMPTAGVPPGQGKTAQQSAPARGPGAGFDTVPPAFRGALQEDTVLADEDNPMFGDQLELLSPAEISLTRYKQHHEWMEEIMSSPYAANQIVPVDLGLRLTGELSELTDGLWESVVSNGAKNGTANDVATYRRLDDAKMKNLQERISAYLKGAEEQIKEMRVEHGQKMEELSKQKLFANLERRLAEASLDHRIDDIVRDAETATASEVVAFDEVKQVQKGGLLTDEDIAPPRPPTNTAPDDEPPPGDEFGDLTNLDTAGEALDFYGESMDFPT